MVKMIEAFLHLASNVDRAHAVADAEPASFRRIEQERQHPVSFAEIVSASSFLDFGGVPDGRWFHALYAWRNCEADAGGPVSENGGSAPQSRASDDSRENDVGGERVTWRRSLLWPRRFRA
jgi:hypothetical protein